MQPLFWTQLLPSIERKNSLCVAHEQNRESWGKKCNCGPLPHVLENLAYLFFYVNSSSLKTMTHAQYFAFLLNTMNKNACPTQILAIFSLLPPSKTKHTNRRAELTPPRNNISEERKGVVYEIFTRYYSSVPRAFNTKKSPKEPCSCKHTHKG